jgi:hypothetical protein
MRLVGGIWAALAAAFLAPVVSEPVAVATMLAGTEKPRDRLASCVVMVQNDASGGGNEPYVYTTVLQSSAVAGEAARAVLGVDPESYHKIMDVRAEVSHTMRGTFIHLKVGIDPGDKAAPDIAQRVLEEMVNRFGRIVSEVSQNRRDDLNGQIRVLKDRHAQSNQELFNVQQELKALRMKPEARGLSTQEMRFEGNRLRQEVENQRRELLSLKERQQYAAPPPSPADVPSGAEVAAQWQRVVDLRQARLEELRRRGETEKVDPVEVAEAEAQLAEARAQLLQHVDRRAVVIRGGIGPGGRLRGTPQPPSEEMVAAVEAQLKQNEARLQSFDPVAAAQLASDIEDRESQERLLRERISTLGKQIEDLEQALLLTGTASVKVLGAPDRVEPGGTSR